MYCGGDDMETKHLDENLQNDMRLVAHVCGRLFNYRINPNIKKKRTYGAWKALEVFMRGILKRKRNAKKM